jgi:hypothetical protein
LFSHEKANHSERVGRKAAGLSLLQKIIIAGG